MKNFLTFLVLTLVIVGALNWLLVGVFSFDLVAFLLGNMTTLSRVIYGAVGVAGLWLLGATIFGNGKLVSK
ncbi:MAG: DUF378 domain-containing protein [Clostridia bacterium]|nr:DUF378 domain-containing protein [Clostridia bacterium]